MKNFKFIKAAFFSLFLVLSLGACKDACKDSPCLNGASCTDVDGEAVCTCATGYGGDNCEVVFRDAFLGSFDGVYCQDPLFSYTSVISAKSGSVTDIEFSDFARLNSVSGLTESIYAVVVDEQNITIPKQWPASLGGDTVSGTGGIDINGQLTITHKLSGIFGDVDCVDVLTPQ